MLGGFSLEMILFCSDQSVGGDVSVLCLLDERKILAQFLGFVRLFWLWLRKMVSPFLKL